MRFDAVVFAPLFLWLVMGIPALRGQEDPHAHHKEMLEKGSKKDSAQPQEGLEIPDITLLNQDGEEVAFYSDLVAGKVVAMNFIFTTCTTVCPPKGATFARVQQELADKVGDTVHLISISVDPTTDTPERMRAWGERFGAGPGWTLVTGSKPEVDRLLKSLQVFTADFRDHSPTVLVGNDPARHWMRAYGLAPPAELAKLIEDVEKEEDR